MFFYAEALKDATQLIPRGIKYFRAFTDFNDGILASTANRQLDKVSGDDRTLTIHIRSGDIFEEMNPHPGYGQPPLCFYQKCISHFNPSKVLLVYQNLSNPVIEALQSWLSSNSIQFQIQTSVDLREDVQALMLGNTFILSRGSFMMGVLALKKNVSRVYLFGKNEGSKLKGSISNIDKLIEIHDLDNSYSSEILNNNWKNTNEQRNLMTSFPIESLGLTINA